MLEDGDTLRITCAAEEVSEASAYSDWRLYVNGSGARIYALDPAAQEARGPRWQWVEDRASGFSGVLRRLATGIKPFTSRPAVVVIENAEGNAEGIKGALRFKVRHLGDFISFSVVPSTPALMVADEASLLLDEAGKQLLVQLRSPKAQACHGLMLVCGMAPMTRSNVAAFLVRETLLHSNAYCIVVEDTVDIHIGEPPLGEGLVGERGSFVDRLDVSSIGVARGIRLAMREFPATQRGILVVGEIRVAEDILEVFNAIEAGHWVVSTFIAKLPNDAVDMLIDRMVMAGFEESRARERLAKSLAQVVATSPRGSKIEVSAYGLGEEQRRRIRGREMPFIGTVHVLRAADNVKQN
ncbi:MAG: hypothetical protein JNM52_09420 [Betaproteobacteria bacterium]|nr:hypothetical protein [Betaproteobacteria bacterium]